MGGGGGGLWIEWTKLWGQFDCEDADPKILTQSSQISKVLGTLIIFTNPKQYSDSS